MNIKSTSIPKTLKVERAALEAPAKGTNLAQDPVDQFVSTPETPSFLQAFRPNRKKMASSATAGLATVALAGVAAVATEVAGPGVGLFGTTAVVTAANVIRAHKEGSSLGKAALLGAQIGFYGSLIGQRSMGLDNMALALGASGAAMSGVTYLALSGLERKR